MSDTWRELLGTGLFWALVLGAMHLSEWRHRRRADTFRPPPGVSTDTDTDHHHHHHHQPRRAA